VHGNTQLLLPLSHQIHTLCGATAARWQGLFSITSNWQQLQQAFDCTMLNSHVDNELS
jgi:hypothetical protein